MRHYEIVFLIHPDWCMFVPTILDNYKSIVEDNYGVVHRFESWGLRKMAYKVRKADSAFYVLMNIECTKNLLCSLVNSFKYNEAVIRSLVLRERYAIKEDSDVVKLLKRSSV
jgi:small subunit ribosomal protein S6